MSTPDMLAPPGLCDVITCNNNRCLFLSKILNYYIFTYFNPCSCVLLLCPWLTKSSCNLLFACTFIPCSSLLSPPNRCHPSCTTPPPNPGSLHIFIFPTSLDRLVKLSPPTISLKPAIRSPLIGSVSPPYEHIPITHACTCTHCACHLVSVLNRCSAVKRTVTL